MARVARHVALGLESSARISRLGLLMRSVGLSSGNCWGGKSILRHVGDGKRGIEALNRCVESGTIAAEAVEAAS